MEIIEKKNDNELVLSLKGRLDTLTSPLLEGKIKEVNEDIKKLVLDFAELEYISSAGLRVLLQAQKKMMVQGELVIKNINDVILEILTITGFKDILTIE